MSLGSRAGSLHRALRLSRRATRTSLHAAEGVDIASRNHGCCTPCKCRTAASRRREAADERIGRDLEGLSLEMSGLARRNAGSRRRVRAIKHDNVKASPAIRAQSAARGDAGLCQWRAVAASKISPLAAAVTFGRAFYAPGGGDYVAHMHHGAPARTEGGTSTGGLICKGRAER